MLNRETLYSSMEPVTKVVADGVVIESQVTIAARTMLTHVQYATAHDDTLVAAKEETKRHLWRIIYCDIAAALESIASRSEDHNTADELRSLVAKLAP